MLVLVATHTNPVFVFECDLGSCIYTKSCNTPHVGINKPSSSLKIAGLSHMPYTSSVNTMQKGFPFHLLIC
jgi:hypothetical protein